MQTHVRSLWLSAAGGGLSNWTIQVALFYAVLRLHGASQLAWVVLAGTIPSLLLGPFLGTAVDHWHTARTSQLAGFLQALSLLALAEFIGGSLAGLAFSYAIYNTFNALGSTARQRLLYNVTPPAERATANAAIGGVGGVVTVIGAGLGGSVALFGPIPVLLGAVGLRFVSTLCLLRVWPELSSITKSTAREPYWLELREGLRALSNFSRATSVILVGIAWGLIGGGYDVLLSDYGVHLLHGGGGGLSTLYVVDGIGVMLGAIVARRVATAWKGHVYGWSYMLQGVFWTLFALSRTLMVAVPLLLVMRFASGVIIAWDTTLLLETVPDRLHGRVYSLHNATYGAVMRVSLALTGTLLALVGARDVAIGAGIGSIAVGLSWWLAVGRKWSGGMPKAHASHGTQERRLGGSTSIDEVFRQRSLPGVS